MTTPWQRIRQKPGLGTFVEIGVAVTPGADPDAIIDKAFAGIADIQRLMSFHDPDSDLSRLNRAQGEAVALDRRTICVLRLARALMRASGGLFDCTVGAQLVAQGRLPDHGIAAEASGRAEHILIEGGTVRLAAPVLITLDGIAKGYAVDGAIDILRRSGCIGGYVNAGGDMRVFGRWPLPVHRREVDGAIRPLGALKDNALATSSFGQDAARFPGLIVGSASPEPGVFSVISRRAWRADALTKVAALTPADRRADVVAGLGGLYVEPQ